mgnify:CR=1 FL=1
MSTATIYDVAERAGVSPATVSRVYNGVGVSPAKTEAVQRAARELKFVPNSTARNLRTGSANAIALVIPDIENPYFTETARGIEDVASAAGYSVMLCNSDGDIAKESTYLGIAASLACGYLGLMEQKKPKAEFKGDAYDGDGDIPQVLGSALDLFKEATPLHEVLGPEFARVYAIVKRAEYEEFLHVISPWEREHLLINV